VSADAVLLMTAHVLPEFAGGGLGRMLLQGVAKDLVRRGVKAIEAFGDMSWEGIGHCVIPADYLLAVGFKTVRPHPRYPRLRRFQRLVFPRRIGQLQRRVGRVFLQPTCDHDGVGNRDVR
jgi:GNAT superfamily N-acetyltransferase